MAKRQLASSSAHQKRTTAGSTMEILRTEGSNVLIAEEGRKQPNISGSCENVLTGVPRKPSLDVPQSPSHGVPQSPSHRVTSGGGLERVGSSSSEESGDEEDESGDEEDESGEQEKEDIERTPEQILEAAGVDMASLEGLSCDERHRAPLELLTEFLSCVMREKYEAARLLCEKVLQLEPTNQFAAEYLPVIVERLQINIELSSDESDDNGHTSSDDSHTSSNGNHTTTLQIQTKPLPPSHTYPHHC